MFAERCGDADEDGVGLGKTSQIRGGVEAALAFDVGDERLAEMLEIVFAALKRFNFFWVYVKTDHGKTGAMESRQKRQADITEADDTDDGGAIGNFFCQRHIKTFRVKAKKTAAATIVIGGRQKSRNPRRIYNLRLSAAANGDVHSHYRTTMRLLSYS